MGRRFGGDKQLAAVFADGSTILDRTMANAATAGLAGAVVVVRPDIADAMRAHGDARWSLPFDLAMQPEPRGTADALRVAAPMVGGPFVVANADDLYGPGALASLASRRRGHALVGYAIANTLLDGRPVNRARCRMDDRGNLASIDEGRVEAMSWAPLDGKDVVPLRGDELVSMNLWRFERSALEHVEAAARRVPPGDHGELMLPDVVRSFLDAEPVAVIPTDERCLGVTRAADVALLLAAVGES